MVRTGRPRIERKQVTCEECGKVFEVRVTENRRFCSKSCRAKWQTRVGARPRVGESAVCATCGKTFYRSPGEIMRNRRFCSPKCAYVGRTHVEPKSCPVCGTSFTSHNGKYCSRECWRKASTKHDTERQHNGRAVKRNQQGYLLVYEPNHGNADKNGYVLEHRFVVSQQIGRPLTSEEHVHHISGDRADNRPENLQIISNSDHGTLTGTTTWERMRAMEEQLAEYQRRYGPLDKEL